MVGTKTKYGNQLQLSNSLRLKLFKQDVDIDAILNKNRKQTHSSHTPKYWDYSIKIKFALYKLTRIVEKGLLKKYRYFCDFFYIN